MNLVDHTCDSIEKTLRGESKLTPEALALPGFCSASTRRFLNNVCSFDGATYLEIGVFKGATLLAAAYRNPGTFTGIDNFWMDRFAGPVACRRDFTAAARRFRKECRVQFHDVDCWQIDLGKLPAPVNVYFYDGDHSYEGQYRAFAHFDSLFARRFVAVVDDWNRETVRKATRAAFRDLGYTALLLRGYRTPSTLHEPWSNGLLIAVLEKPGRRSRTAKTPATAKPQAKKPATRSLARGKSRKARQ